MGLDILNEIWRNTLSLMDRSLVLPIIASALLSVITADIVRKTKEIKWFRKNFVDNALTELLDLGLLYIASFGVAILILLTIYFLFCFLNYLLP